MKRLFCLCLFSMIVPGVFAQFSWRLDADFNVRLLSWMTPTGEKAEKLINIGNDTKYNNLANNPNTNSRGDYSYISGTLDVFNYNRADSQRQNEMFMLMVFRHELVRMHLRSNLTNLILCTVAANNGTGANELSGNHSFVMGNGRSPNWGDFLRYSFDEWYIRGMFGFFTVYVGNVSDFGKVNYFDNFSSDFLRNIEVEPLGANTPTAAANYQNNGQDINNLMRAENAGASDPFSYSAIPYFMAAARITQFSFPLTVQIAADAGTNLMNGIKWNYRRMSGAIRISGERVADRITFDAIYKFRGGDSDTLDNYDPDNNIFGGLQPNGTGIIAHAFGVYSNILNVKDFRFALGYSGLFKVYEDSLNKTSGITTGRTGPFFSGFDMRVVYTGINDTIFTFKTNISFANIEKSGTDSISVGLLGTNLAADTGQSWFAVYGALGILHYFTRQLHVFAQFGNRFGKIKTNVTATGAESEVIRMHNRFGGGAFLAFQFNTYLRLQGGLGFYYMNDLYSNSGKDSQEIAATRNSSGGTFEVTVPVRMRISFRP